MSERDYILGTHDAEIQRLGLQHRVWRPRALGAWRDAAFTAGQTLIDVACGPGYATLDLAEIAGSDGQVIALDQSRRFLDFLEATAAQRGLTNIRTREVNLDLDPLPPLDADGAWARWIFAFVSRPKELLKKLRGTLRMGGSLVIHEYLDYSTWRLAPRSEVFEEWVTTVMASWRSTGGEPDIGFDLPGWLDGAGFKLRRMQPILELVTPEDYLWQWPKAFVQTGVDRMVELGQLEESRGREIQRIFADREATPGAMLVTPSVIEIIATAV